MKGEHTIGEIAEVLRGATPAKRVETDLEEPKGIPFFGLHEITDGGTTHRSLEPSVSTERAVILRRGDVVVALLGAIGTAAIVSEETDGAVLGRECAALRLRSGEDRLTPEWLHLAFESWPVRERARAMATGQTMPRLTPKALGELVIPTPPLKVQAKLIDRIARFDEAIKWQEDLLTTLRELRGWEIELAVSALVPSESQFVHRDAALARLVEGSPREDGELEST
jgi:restriction endonuclease S subunit